VGLRGERLDHGVSALRMEFLGGSPCDLRNNASRASTLEMFCGLPWGYRYCNAADYVCIRVLTITDCASLYYTV
jgi:hypothetical protein